MARNWLAVWPSYLVVACSGGQGDQMITRPTEVFSDPGMQQAATLLQHGDYPAAVDAARRSSGLNSVSQDDASLLGIAASENDRGGVRALLAAGANPNISEKRAPIAVAAELADPEVVSDLLNAGADPNGRVGSETALWRAAIRNNFTIVEMLLHRGANIDAANASGATPALAATQAAKYRMAVFLLQKGASPMAKSKDGISIAEWAASGRMHPETEEGRARQQLYELLRQAGAM